MALQSPECTEANCTPAGCEWGNSNGDVPDKGWAMFHVTGLAKNGNAPQSSGWFLPMGVENPNLTITRCTGTICPTLGTPDLRLIN